MQELKTLPSAVYPDLEWNCTDRPRPGNSGPEIVEIGLVALDPASLRLIGEANYLVRPRHLDISLLFTAMTDITRDGLVGANPLGQVLSTITGAWPGNGTCFTWGNDSDFLTQPCIKRSLAVPFRRFVDLGREFQHTHFFFGTSGPRICVYENIQTCPLPLRRPWSSSFRLSMRTRACISDETSMP